MSESPVRLVLKVEDVEGLVGECLQERLGLGGRRKRDRRTPSPLHPLTNAKVGSHRWIGAQGNGLAYWGPSAETMDLSLDTDVHVS